MLDGRLTKDQADTPSTIQVVSNFEKIDAGKEGYVLYGPGAESAGRYSPAKCIGTRKERMMGSPDKAHVSTSNVERQDLTMRMSIRRFTRLTNAFSKKAESHEHAIALYFTFYNFARMHKTLKCSPAMAAGISKTLWSTEDIVALIDARAEAPRARGAYKPRQPKTA